MFENFSYYYYRLIICCCSCENDVLTVFTVTDLNLLSPVSRKVPGHLSKKKGDLPSESIESRGEFSWRTNYRRWLQSDSVHDMTMLYILLFTSTPIIIYLLLPWTLAVWRFTKRRMDNEWFQAFQRRSSQCSVLFLSHLFSRPNRVCRNCKQPIDAC